jgi:tryptophan halogenase
MSSIYNGIYKVIDQVELDISHIVDGTTILDKLTVAGNSTFNGLIIPSNSSDSDVVTLDKTVNFIDYNNTLINNRVSRIKIPYTDKEKQLKNYTNCVALNNGWCWEIPLWDTLSLGYVHSLKFADESTILEEFIQHVDRHCAKIKEEDISIINYKTGRHKKGWVKNVIGVGLSYGFLEPLESTGILTLLHNAFKALEMLSKRDFNYTNVDRDIFNYSVSKEIEYLKGFIEMHYAFSSRDDSEYWRYVTENIEYPKNETTEYFKIIKQTVDTRNYASYDTGVGSSFILAGMGYSHYSPAFNKATPIYQELIQRKNKFIQDDEYYYSIIDSYPSTLEFLKEKIYK